MRRLGIRAICSGGVAAACAVAAWGVAAVPAGAAVAKKSQSVKWVHGHPTVKGQSLSISNIGGPAITQISTYWTNRKLKSWGVTLSFGWSSSTSVGAASLVSGRADVVEGSLPNVLPGVENGLNAKAIALTGPRLTYAFVSRKTVKSVSQLKGHTIAAGNCTHSELIYPLGKQALSSAGISETTVSCAALGDQSNRIAGVLSGRVTASVLGHAALLKLSKTGVHNLFTFTKKDPDLYTGVVWATPGWIKTHPALAEAIAAAYMDFYRWFDNPNHRQNAVTLALKTTPGATFSQTLDLFNLQEKDHLYPANAHLTVKAMTYQNHLYQGNGVLTKSDPVSSFTTIKYSNIAWHHLSKKGKK